MSENGKGIKNNSEILYIYEAIMCNPNGDPDNENKPRMDWKTRRNLVSDVRLKRYIRDYLHTVRDQDIFVRKVDGHHVDATDRIKQLLEGKNTDLKDSESILQLARETWIDVRLFGAVIPIKGEKSGGGAGQSIAITGPVQFTWGYSLNKVELLDSATITSVFSAAKETGGTFGKDWKVKYSLLAFYGRINKYSALASGMTQDDLVLLDEAIWNALETQTNTRTKIGQFPLLYIRVEMKEDSNRILGDLRQYISIDPDENIESTRDYRLDLTRLIERLESAGFVEKVNIKISDSVNIVGDLERLNDKLNRL